MVISDLICFNMVNSDLKSQTREAVLSEMIDHLFSIRKIQDKNAVLQALLDREKNGSTGIGNGVAVPHARFENLSESVLFVGISKQGVNFDSLDNRPVRVFMLLLSPISDTGTSLKILANIARMVNDRFFTNRLMQASTDKDLYAILKQGSCDREPSTALQDPQ